MIAHTQRIKIILLLFVVTSTIVFDSCLKKDADDPFISLRSRKARVAGDWKMTYYKKTYSSSSVTDIVTSDGSTYTDVSTDASTGYISTWNGVFTMEYTFDRDGTYKGAKTQGLGNGSSYTLAGNWNFTSDVGDAKNKSQITLKELTYSGTGYTNTYTGNYPDDTYDLKELRNKKMAWYKKTTSNYSNNGSSSSSEIEIVFEAK